MTESRSDHVSQPIYIKFINSIYFCQVSHGAIQFTAYEELRKIVVRYKYIEGKTDHTNKDKLLVGVHKSLPFIVSIKSLSQSICNVAL